MLLREYTLWFLLNEISTYTLKYVPRYIREKYNRWHPIITIYYKIIVDNELSRS